MPNAETIFDKCYTYGRYMYHRGSIEYQLLHVTLSDDEREKLNVQRDKFIKDNIEIQQWFRDHMKDYADPVEVPEVPA